MENAIYKDNLLLALEISKNYEFEKQIRLASAHKELLCPDPDCEHRALRYCHGEKKEAYFAHRNNLHCDYALFDKQNTELIRRIKKNVYNHLISLGYNVQMEKKLLPHHYSHLLFTSPDGKSLAVELASNRLLAIRVESLLKQYYEQNMKVKWIVIDEIDRVFQENQTYFIKRFALNELDNNDLLIIDSDCERVAQYRLDKKNYGDKYFTSLDCLYEETGTITDLTLDNLNLSINGFDARFIDWQIIKETRIIEQRKREEEQKLRYQKMLEESKKQREIDEKTKLDCESKKLEDGLLGVDTPATHSNGGFYFGIKKVSNQTEQEKTDEELKLEILAKIEQQDYPVYDSMGTRWVKCEKCGLIAKADVFYFYGGENHVNLGECNSCLRKRMR
ncbi:MAG: hypothetical protein K2G44_00325 [Clostridia bacterium]|nr:hypothetical protein [Clostridia bacterium]